MNFSTIRAELEKEIMIIYNYLYKQECKICVSHHPYGYCDEHFNDIVALKSTLTKIKQIEKMVLDALDKREWVFRDTNRNIKIDKSIQKLKTELGIEETT